MKVKQLKEILSKMNEEYDVVVTDVSDKGIAISGVWNNAPCVCIETRQEFPEAWYNENGEEIVIGYELRPDDVSTDVYQFYSEELFGGEISVRLQVHDGYAEGDGVRVEYPKLKELTQEQISKIDDYIGGRIHDSGFVTPDDVLLKYGKVVSFYGIMDSNSHDAVLVKKINVLWAERKNEFQPILCALYYRDIDEITDSDAFQIPKWLEWKEYNDGVRTGDWSAYNDRAYADMQTRWDDYAENYLAHIADDGDLETIIDFLR